MLETALVKHCAPTLARLKPGNMFVLAGLDGREAAREMRALNRLLAPKGVALTVLRRCGGKTLFYLYRPDELAAILGAEAARAFLRHCGYGEFGSEAALRVLRRRLRAGEGFPHEVGVFLGYPLKDVLGFIRRRARLPAVRRLEGLCRRRRGRAHVRALSQMQRGVRAPLSVRLSARAPDGGVEDGIRKEG